MHLILALVESPSTRITHDWRGRCGDSSGGGVNREAERREEWPWIKLWCRDAVQWAAVAERYKAYDRCSSWKHITAPGSTSSEFFLSVLRGIPNQSSQSFDNCQLKFFPVVCTQMFTITYACHSQWQSCAHTNISTVTHPSKQIHTCDKNKKQTFFFYFAPLFSWNLHSCSHKCVFSTVAKATLKQSAG